MKCFKGFALIATLACSSVFTKNVQAQCIGTDGYCAQQSYEYHQRIYEEQKRAQNEANQQATNQRAFREQEARNQAIRNADYWGAIADGSHAMSKANNQSTAIAASKAALSECSSDGDDCNLVITFKNMCAYATRSIKSKNTYFIGKDKNPNVAYNSAWMQCQDKNGVGNCIGGIKPVCSGFAENGKSYEELGF